MIENITSKYFYPLANPKYRIFALFYFSTLIVLWVLAGHFILGFEQSLLQPTISVLTAIIATFVLEYFFSVANSTTPRYAYGSLLDKIVFILPAVIPGCAVGMLIYPNEVIWPMIFASALSIASKVLVRVPINTNGDSQHLFNPSNFGITLTLLAFPWIGLAPPYHFTSNLEGIWHYLLPAFVLITGIIVHGLFTGRLPLVMAWIGGFVLHGLFRSLYFNTPWFVSLVPMTSAAFILFTLYMIPDPATTPRDTKYQILFGLCVAFIYGLLLANNMVFGLFLSLFITCIIRGIYLYIKNSPSLLQSLNYLYAN
jgi:enediyne biosynthesis protein E5